MTKIHHHNHTRGRFLISHVKGPVELAGNSKLSRRDFLRGGTVMIGGALFSSFLKNTFSVDATMGSGEGRLFDQMPGKRIYIAPDDHTDYFWSAGEEVYRQAFLDMIDFYLDLADTTEGNPPEHQSRWNCDGSFWLWTYEKNKSKAEYDRLISRVKDGHISFPLNALVICLGGVPAEAVLRGMYYAGKIERRENLRFRLATSMENHTLPYGLVSLWAGSGVRFSWKGICGCDTLISNPGEREHDIYWWEGLDGSRILMKWNSNLPGTLFQGTPGQRMGGYAEARYPAAVVEYVDSDPDFASRYPYNIIGCFGYGWDDIQTLTDAFVTVSKELTNDERLVLVSNEEDFFIDFEINHGASLPSISASFGNQWELYCAALAETSASVKRSVEMLRSAEAMAALITLGKPKFMDERSDDRDRAWMGLGLYWEHNLGMVGPPSGLVEERIAWQKRLDREISAYVDLLFGDSVIAFGDMIEKNGSDPCFYVFNPLSWMRSDYADIPFDNSNPVYVVDKTSDEEVPSQRVVINGKEYLRILASQVPSLGYKVFEIQPGAGKEFTNAAFVKGSVIENQYYRIAVAENGAIASWKDKTRNNREFVRSVNGRTVNDFGNSTGSIQIENEGPVSVTLLVTSPLPLIHTNRITLLRDSARVDLQNAINQNFNDVQTWSFSFDLDVPSVWHEEVGAIINARLMTDGGYYSPRAINSRYDWLTLNHFADMSSGDIGVTLSNADCYFMRLGNSSVSELDIHTPQITVLAGGRVVNGGNGLPNQGGAESFLQRFALCTHGVYDPVFAMKFALEHQNPFVTGEVRGNSGYPGDQYSFLEIDNPNVLAWAVKPAEDGVGAGIVIRVWNLSQNEQSFSLHLNGKIVKALNLTHIETPLGNATVQDGVLVDSLNIQQMKTYAVFIEGSDVPSITPIPPSPTSITDSTSPTAVATPFDSPAPDGKGCLYGLLNAMLGLFK